MIDMGRLRNAGAHHLLDIFKREDIAEIEINGTKYNKNDIFIIQFSLFSFMGFVRVIIDRFLGIY